MSIVKKRRVSRKWNKEWEKKYLLIVGKNEDSQCLICYQTVSEKKEGKLERHFSSKLKNILWGLSHELISLNIVSWEIVRHMRPFTDGEFIKERMIKVAAQLFPDKVDIQRAFKDISFSARTVARRADMLSSNIEDQLDDDIRKSEFVTLALSESTDITGSAQLCIFIRYVFENSIMKEESLDLVSPPKTTTGQDTSDALIEVLKKHHVPLDKISSIATDGAASMVGKTKEQLHY